MPQGVASILLLLVGSAQAGNEGDVCNACGLEPSAVSCCCYAFADALLVVMPLLTHLQGMHRWPGS